MERTKWTFLGEKKRKSARHAFYPANADWLVDITFVLVFMEHETQFEVEDAAPRRRPLVWVVRGLLTICGAMMALVILSEPRVAAQLQQGANRIATLLAGDETVAQLETDTVPAVPSLPKTPAPAARSESPKVLNMPTNRVPVRRGSIVLED